MGVRQFFIENVEAELPRFENVWNALPKEKLDWRPHERSKSAGELLRSMAYEAACYPIFLKTGLLDTEKFQSPAAETVEELWTVFRNGFAQAQKIVAEMTDQDWNSPSKMTSGETVHWESTKQWMAWGLLLDMIHHRGQLSVYIRPMGGKVPSIYGPSADSM